MYKVTSNYEPPQSDSSEFLKAEKGDIIIDGEVVDEEWFRGKNALTEQCGKIPRNLIVSFYQASENAGQENFVGKDPLVISYSDFEKRRLSNSYLGRQMEEDADNESDESQSPETIIKREPNYVEMSSEERVNVPTQINDAANPVAKPPRSNDAAKTSDEGYNSASYYSGEANETNLPLLTKPISRQDEAGYEVPQITIEINKDEHDKCCKTNNEKGKKRLLRTIFRNSVAKNGGKNVQDDVQEKYYNPPADIRNNYFLPPSACPIVRVLLSLIAALSVAFAALFLLLVSLHPVLAFSIAFVLFVVVFVVPVTLLPQGFLCVVSLIIPSIFSTRTKIALIILLLVLLIVGPIIGIAEKLDVATSCKNGPIEYFEMKSLVATPRATLTLAQKVSSNNIQEKCMESFKLVDTDCFKRFQKLQDTCVTLKSQLNSVDNKLCDKRRHYFCQENTTLRACLVNTPPHVYTTDTLRSILIYLLPLLVLLLLGDAYIYNKVYLTTKNADNIYITQRLKQLDCERKVRGLTDLILPLTRIEFQVYALRARLALSKSEKLEIVKWLGILLIFGLTAMCFILLEDYIHSAFLNSLVTQCKSFYEQNSRFMYTTYIYIILGVLLFIILTQSYFRRLPSKICDSFYRDMVDIRAKHLYYKILHDRHSFSRHIRRKIQLLAEAKRLSRKISSNSMLYQVLPDRLQWFVDRIAIKQCMICDSLTSFKSVECAEPNCRAHYCYECFVDAGEACLTCKQLPVSPAPNIYGPTNSTVRPTAPVTINSCPLVNDPVPAAV